MKLWENIVRPDPVQTVGIIYTSLCFASCCAVLQNIYFNFMLCILLCSITKYVFYCWVDCWNSYEIYTEGVFSKLHTFPL
jgi:hypothetical protein